MTFTPPQTKDEFLHTLSDMKKKFSTMEPELEVTVRDPEMGVEGFIVVWNTGICNGGPLDNDGKGVGKGGTRILPNLSFGDVRRLARAMAEKNAAAGLPLGGAKSGMVGSTHDDDYETKYRRFVQLIGNSGTLVEHGGIFGGLGYDVGNIPPLNGQWACEELNSFNSFTGKSIENGGTDYDRQGIAGLGVASAATTLLQCKDIQINTARFSVHGLGAMGAAVTYYFHQNGARLTALSDPKYGGTWAVKDGASDALITALFKQDEIRASALLKEEGTLLSENTEEALYADVDVVFPCALEDVIHYDNAHKIIAPFICEGANNPTTDEAHHILYQNGKISVPDIIANAGGIIAAYVELTSDISIAENADTGGKVQQAKDETTRRISANTHELLSIVEKFDVQPDMAGDFMAYRNIFYGIPSDGAEILNIQKEVG